MKKLFLFLRFFLAFLILFILSYKLGFASIFKTLSQVSFLYILPILFLWFILFAFSAYNLRILLNALKVKIRFSKLFRYYLLSWSSGLFLPGKIGELVLIHFFKKENLKLGQGFAIYFIDKLITVFVLFLISSIGLLIFFNLNQILIYLVIFLFIFILFLLFILTSIGRSFIKKYILRNYSSYFEGFSKTLLYFFRFHKKNLFANLVVTMIKSIISAFAVSLYFLSFNHPINLFYVLMLDSIITLISFIPLTLNGLGIRESSAVILYGLLGFNPLIVASAHIFGAILTYFMGFIIFILVKMEDFF